MNEAGFKNQKGYFTVYISATQSGCHLTELSHLCHRSPIHGFSRGSLLVSHSPKAKLEALEPQTKAVEVTDKK